jgi:DNA repair exonuclease SbcCD nuclease subunit
MRLLHCADIHLGRQRLGGRLPDTDFADAFRHVCRAAVARRADALLICGDLFDSPTIAPPHLRQAVGCLEPLAEAGIPALAIEGNHDKATVGGAEPTWVTYLSDAGLLRLLRMPFVAGRPQITPWTAEAGGTYVELGGVRFVGAGYLGSYTPRRLRAVTEQLDPAVPTVLLLHAGPDYFVAEGGGFDRQAVEAVRGRVCYLALGHMHKPMRHGRWAVNPGAPENVRLTDQRYGRGRDDRPQPRGLAVVDIDPAASPPAVHVEIVDTPRRPVLVREVDCSPFARKRKGVAEAILEQAAQCVADGELDERTAVRIELGGLLNVRHAALNVEGMSAALRERLGVAVVDVDLSKLRLFTGRKLPGAVPQVQLGREQLERQALAALLADSPLAGLEDDAQIGAMVALCRTLKQHVRDALPDGPDEAAVEGMVEAVLASPLLDALVSARAAARQPAPQQTPQEGGSSP